MESKMQSLHIDLPKSAIRLSPAKDATKTNVAESWEDEDLDGDAETPKEGTLMPVESNDAGTHPPPPTPISPTSGSTYDWSTARVLGGGRPQPMSSGRSTPRSENEAERRRPEKTTATAGRMIAAGLGMKLPKKTEEQRQYDRAMREQEMKRKNREKEAKEHEREQDEKAKDAVWGS